MKRWIAYILMLAIVLSMTACGGSDAKKVDLNALYEILMETTPEMILIDDTDLQLDLFGIRPEDCAQVITAVCADGLRTDEIWLIEAKDGAALERIAQLAENRLFAKGEESITYSPEQYAIVQEAETVTEGNYFVLLVSPDVEILKAAVDSAMQ